MSDAVAAALSDAMDADDRVVVLGEDVARAEGVFKTTVGLLDRHGPDRVRDTPISEMGFLGAAVGAAVAGLRPVVEIMFAEFLGVALDQLVTEAAKMRYLSDGALATPLVVRGSAGPGLGFGCQHSQTMEHWLVGTPGLRVVMPSGAASAYRLLRAAILDDNPVVVLEPRALYSRREEVERTADHTDLMTARVVRPGGAATVFAAGQTVAVAMAAADRLAPRYDLAVVDVASLYPLDVATIGAQTAATGRVAVVDDSPGGSAWGANLTSYVAQRHFSTLRAPVLRVSAPPAPVPFAASLEQRYVPSPDYLAAQLSHWLEKGEMPAPWWEEYTGDIV